jgi:hypothetical protein
MKMVAGNGACPASVAGASTVKLVLEEEGMMVVLWVGSDGDERLWQWSMMVDRTACGSGIVERERV